MHYLCAIFVYIFLAVGSQLGWEHNAFQNSSILHGVFLLKILLQMIRQGMGINLKSSISRSSAHSCFLKLYIQYTNTTNQRIQI